MSLQNTYLTIWKATVYYMIFNMASDILDLVKLFVQEHTANSDKNIQTDLIIMDFAKAFDKLPHQRLLCKFKFYGIKNETLSWISVFLSNRTQTVVLDVESLYIATVTFGVP